MTDEEQDRRSSWATWVETAVEVDYGVEWTPALCNRIADALCDRLDADRRTGGERYLESRLDDPEYRRFHQAAAERIAQAGGDAIVASGGHCAPVSPQYDPMFTGRPVHDAIEDAHARKELEYGAHLDAGRFPSFEQYVCGQRIETDGTLSSFLTGCHLVEGHDGDHWWSPFHLCLGKVRFVDPEGAAIEAAFEMLAHAPESFDDDVWPDDERSIDDAIGVLHKYSKSLRRGQR